jgi:hypothetical protein
MRKRLSIVVLATFMVVCMIVLALKTQRWMQIDSCLDRGGKWNYREHKCEQRQ